MKKQQNNKINLPYKSFKKVIKPRKKKKQFRQETKTKIKKTKQK